MPDWMKGKPEILGIEILKGNEESGNHLRNYTVFFPHILFLTLSVYAAKMIPEWHEHAKIVQEDMQ